MTAYQFAACNSQNQIALIGTVSKFNVHDISIEIDLIAWLKVVS